MTMNIDPAWLALPPDAKVLCAVSGGADSIALLHMCARLWRQGDLAGLSAAHYHHGLRGAAADADERFVRETCLVWGVPCFVGHGDAASAAKLRGMGLEEAARFLRYAFLEATAIQANASIILTAHNADDNLETILLNLTRGTGLDGLCGIAPVTLNSPLSLLRPLLFLTRTDILAYLSENGLAHREDESNKDAAFTRNRLRHEVLPVLREINPKAAAAAGQTSALLRADAEALRHMAVAEAEAHGTLSEGGRSWFPVSRLMELPLPVASRVIRLLCRRAGWHGPSHTHVQAILALCGSESPHAAAPLPDGWTARREYGGLRIAPADDGPRTFMVSIRDMGAYDPGIVYKSFNPFYVADDTIVGAIRVRARQEGDRIALIGAPGTRALNRLMMDRKIPLAERNRVAVIADDAGVIAAEGLGIDRSRAPHEGAGVLELTVEN